MTNDFITKKLQQFRKGFVVKHMLTREPLVGWYDDDGAVRNWEPDRIEHFLATAIQEAVAEERKEDCKSCAEMKDCNICKDFSRLHHEKLFQQKDQ